MDCGFLWETVSAVKGMTGLIRKQQADFKALPIPGARGGNYFFEVRTQIILARPRRSLGVSEKT